MSGLLTIPARRGKAVVLRAGQAIRIVNTHGAQVVDTWAFVADALVEIMSMEHTRATLLKMRPGIGDHLYTNKRRPILTLEADTSPGIHDTLIAACDNERYGLLGCTEYHDNCTDNLHAAMNAIGLRAPENSQPAQPVHEHPLDRTRRPVVRGAGDPSGRLRHPARPPVLRGRDVRLPAGHSAHQRPPPDRGALRSD